MGICSEERHRKFCLSIWFAFMVSTGAAWAQGTSVYEQDLKAFIATIDQDYPFLDLKGIRPDWEALKPRLLECAKACTTDEAFLPLVFDAIKCLRDAHMGLRDTRVPLPPFPSEYYPGLGFMPATEERVVVMSSPREGPLSALKPGTVVTRIDGKPAREFLEVRALESWKEGGFFSSPQRARLFAYRSPLRGERGDKHVLTYEEAGGEKELTVACEMEAQGWPHVYNMPEGLVGESGDVRHTELSSEVGYIYLRRVRGSDTATGLAAALKASPDVKGWIIDLRGNGGGGYDEGLKKTIEGMSRPVAAITDAGCISAGETLVRDIKRLTEARVFGQTTAGASSSKRQWPFPSGIATVTIPTSSRWQNDGQPIEFNGIKPDEEVEAVPEEVRAGKNSEILRAEAWVLEHSTKKEPPETPSSPPAPPKLTDGEAVLPPMTHP